MECLKPGTICETNGLPAFGGFPGVAPEQIKICKPRKCNLPLPGPDWYIIEWPEGGRSCMNRSGFRVIDNREGR